MLTEDIWRWPALPLRSIEHTGEIKGVDNGSGGLRYLRICSDRERLCSPVAGAGTGGRRGEEMVGGEEDRLVRELDNNARSRLLVGTNKYQPRECRSCPPTLLGLGTDY